MRSIESEGDTAHWALEATTDKVILVDREFRITFINKAAATLNGISQESVLGRTLWETWPGNVGTDIEKNYRKAMSEGVPVRFTHCYFQPGKFDLFLEIKAYPSPDGLAIFFHETSDAKREADDKERLASAIRATDLGVWRCELPLSREPFYWSPQVRRHFGISDDEPIGVEEFLALLHPDDRQMTSDAMARAIEGHLPYDVVYRTIGRDGRTRWVRATGNAFYREDGSPFRFDGFTVELTDRIEAEERIRENEREVRRAYDRLLRVEEDRRLALDSAGIGSWNIDLKTFEMATDARFRTIFGVVEDVVSYERALEIIHPDDREAVKQKVADACRTVEPLPYSMEYRVVHPDGSIRWVSAQGRANYSPDLPMGVPVTFDGTVIDMTESRASAEALRTSEERFRAAQETTPDPFTIIEAVRDEEGHVIDFRWTFVNEATGRLTGETSEELLGKLVSEKRPGIRESELYRGWLHTVETGEPFSREVFMNFPSGRTFLRLTGVKVGDGIATSFTDLTQRRLNEERLERAVSDRTSQLEAAVKEAEGFNYSIAHDLRTPLRAIASTSSILIEEAGSNLSDAHRELLIRQNENAIRLGRLIDELLPTLATGRADVNRDSLDLTALVRASFNELEAQLRTNGCRLESQEGMQVEADADLVGTVIENLIGNACKFSPDGGTIRIRQVGKVISIADEGVGFEMKFAPKIFLPFERLVTEEQLRGRESASPTSSESCVAWRPCLGREPTRLRDTFFLTFEAGS